MAHLILGEHPDGLTVRLVHGDGMTLAATLTDSTGAEVDWPAAPSLEFAGPERDVIATHAATIDGPMATWTLTRAQVDTIWDASATRFAGPSTYVRALLPDGGDGSVEYAGKVAWSDGWTAGTQVQVKTFTQPGGPAGAPGASAYEVAVSNGFSGGQAAWLESLVGPPGPEGPEGSLTIVNGGTVTLDDAKPEGTLVGYRVKAAATFEAEAGSATLDPGAYTFERTAAGWTYYLATGTALTAAPVSGWSTIATDNFTAADGTQLVGRTTTTGGLTWDDLSSGTEVTIQSNAARFAGSGYGKKCRLPLGASYAAGLRITFDYVLSTGGSFDVGGTITWTPHVSGIEFGGGNIGTYGAVPPTGLAGSLTGQPASGTFSLEYIGTAMSVKINGTQVATATLGGDPLMDAFDLVWNSATATIDNLVVEAYS